MGSKKLLITGAAIAVVAAAAILVPSVALGVPLARVFPTTAVVAPDDARGEQGNGKAWGHHKGSPDFPGNNGNRNGDKAEGEGAPGNGNGKAWGHHKDSPDFPGNNGRGDKSDDDE